MNQKSIIVILGVAVVALLGTTVYFATINEVSQPVPVPKVVQQPASTPTTQSAMQPNMPTTQPINSTEKNTGDDKFYCEKGSDCIDGEYCKVTNKGGCVNSDWWWKNVGNDYDCLPDPNACSCVNNKCVKK